MGPPLNVRLPEGLRRDCEEIVKYTDRWSSLADFVRDATRIHRDRWIDEAHRSKDRLVPDST